ncbi:MAG: UDP-N-acetylmuramate--alanine ligase [Planctomycetota bacterium]|jgi:UDP-N-acetylmuramate--alanine ligase
MPFESPAPLVSINPVSQTSITKGPADSTHGRAIPHELGLPKNLHLLGAGGAGVSGLARILAERGFTITGHDRADSEFTEQLRSLSIPIEFGESGSASLPQSAQAVIHSAAIDAADPQLTEASKRGIPSLRYGDALGRLTRAQRSVCVSGTHGKTTTSWMLFHALMGAMEAAGQEGVSFDRPGAIVGGVHPVLRASSAAPVDNGWLVVEACEYDRTFLRLSAGSAIVTNVEADHIDYYRDISAVRDAFARFVDSVSSAGIVVAGRDVSEAITSAASCPVLRLGVELKLDLVGEHLGRPHFKVRGPGWSTPVIELAVPGVFNAENAALAIGMAVGLAEREGIPSEAAAICAARGLSRFRGVSRRFESWGIRRGIEAIHDYAHHPTELRATLAAARRAYPGRPLHALFQPHQYSRTAHFFDEFVQALSGVDRLVLCDVYGARVQIDEHVADSAGLVEKLRERGVNATHIPDCVEAAIELARGVTAGAVVLVIGAGDVDQVRDELMDAL